jgi:hypothetical protein
MDKFRLAVAVALLALFATAVTPARAGTITLDGTMSLVWQYDLSTGSFNTVGPLTAAVQIVIDDTPTGGTIVFSPDTIRTYLVGVQVYTSWPSLLGYADLVESDDIAFVQSGSGLWELSLEEDWSGNPGTELGMYFLFPSTGDPANFTPADLDSYLLSQVGSSWGTRMDGGGLQNYLNGPLTSVTINDNAVPEPSYGLVAGILIAVAAAVSHKRPFSGRPPAPRPSAQAWAAVSRRFAPAARWP